MTDPRPFPEQPLGDPDYDEGLPDDDEDEDDEEPLEV